MRFTFFNFQFSTFNFMLYSSHNIFGSLPDGRQGFIVNLLSGQADLLDAPSLRLLQSGALPCDTQEWVEKGYVVEPAAEAARYQAAYLDFLDARDKDEVQIFFVPWYACNFSCSYCFQDTYAWDPSMLKAETLDAFFATVRERFAGRRKYLTLFGGEPLLAGEGHRKAVADFLERARRDDLDVAIVTNGYHLEEYVPLLKNYRIREVQVTLDGAQEFHDKRRMLKGGKPSFDRVVAGVDACVAAGLSVNLRMVVDRDNLISLPELARFAVERGWTRAPGFKTQIGRNYELHSCQQQRSQLYSRVELYADIHQLVLEHPHILEFHRPAFSIVRFLWENGETPKPLFDSCTGTKTEWAFDFQGKIFACTATVGKNGEELGTYWPVASEAAAVVAEWERRDVLAIPECASCNVRLACGGGCTAVAKNQTGNICSPDCRPVQELLGLGMDLYYNEEHQEVQECLNPNA